MGPQAVRRLLLRGANPTLRGVIDGSRVDLHGQFSRNRPKIVVDARGAAEEAKGTLRCFINSIYTGVSTARFSPVHSWSYMSEQDIHEEAAMLLMEEAELGESSALLAA